MDVAVRQTRSRAHVLRTNATIENERLQSLRLSADRLVNLLKILTSIGLRVRHHLRRRRAPFATLNPQPTSGRWPATRVDRQAHHANNTQSATESSSRWSIFVRRIMRSCVPQPGRASSAQCGVTGTDIDVSV